MSLLSLIGIQDAIAQGAPAVPAATTAATTGATQTAPQGTGFMSMIWMLVAFIAIFYFILLRPQSKRAKEQRKLIEGLAPGDEIITTAGLVGKVVKLTDDFVILNVADGVDLKLQKSAVTTILPKGTAKTI